MSVVIPLVVIPFSLTVIAPTDIPLDVPRNSVSFFSDSIEPTLTPIPSLIIILPETFIPLPLLLEVLTSMFLSTLNPFYTPYTLPPSVLPSSTVAIRMP